MAKDSKISWTKHTYNPWIGCSLKSEGCADCYAARSTPARAMRVKWGNGEKRHRTGEATRKAPIRWNREAEKAETRDRVFSLSLGDWLDPEIPIEWLADLLLLVNQTPCLDWLLLTKRIELWRDRLKQVADQPNSDAAAIAIAWLNGKAPQNIWLGVSTENQRRADERIPLLLKIPATVRFLSCEPLLEAINILKHLPTFSDPEGTCGFEPNSLHWVIVGGESGSKKSRPFDLEWARSLIGQCRSAGITPFFKQAGANALDNNVALRLKDPKGGNLDELPLDLKVQELPEMPLKGQIKRIK